MNFKKLLFFIIITPSLLLGMDTTFQTPSIEFVKPRFARQNLTTLEFYFSYNKADSVYNCQGRSLNNLNFAGPELLLKRFIDTNLSLNDTQNFGYATITGNYSAKKLNIGLTQNIGSHFFIDAHTNIIYHQYQNLSYIPINAQGKALTNQQINDIPGFSDYLLHLEQKSGTFNIIKNQTVGPSYVTAGYTNSIQSFQHLDFLDITAQAGIWMPQNDLCSSNHIFQPVINTMYNVGIPIQLSTAIGLYDWLNIGGSALIIPFISTHKTIPINTGSNVCNSFLIDQYASCSIQSNPFLYLNAYLEAEQFIPNITILAGISYVKQGTVKISCPTLNTENVNYSSTIKSWEICNFNLNIEFDLAKNKSKIMPRIKFFYVRPLWGTNAFKTSAYAGQAGIEFRWDF